MLGWAATRRSNVGTPADRGWRMAQPAHPRRAPRPEPIDLPGITPLTSTRLSDDLAGQIRRLIISEDVSEETAPGAKTALSID
jgi:hypothetical protein